ncbi:MAG TPA: nucleotide exchange factor GrpE [Acidimicrobiales bacterium]|nr:nucleotide exchange factor GrpE [Acidimicrobiales bacterium]
MSSEDLTSPLDPPPDSSPAPAEETTGAASGIPDPGAGVGAGAPSEDDPAGGNAPTDDEAAGGNAPGDPDSAGPDPAGGAGDGGTAGDLVEPERLEEVLDPFTAMTIERDEYLDSLRRVQADFENYKKRMVRQQSEQLERAAESLVTKLLPALDTLALALSHVEADSDAGKALTQVSSSIWDVLGKEGLETVDPLDQEFDPNEAEAVMHEPAEGDQTGSVVVEVFRPGYRWRGRVLRAAMVKVRG